MWVIASSTGCVRWVWQNAGPSSLAGNTALSRPLFCHADPIASHPAAFPGDFRHCCRLRCRRRTDDRSAGIQCPGGAPAGSRRGDCDRSRCSVGNRRPAGAPACAAVASRDHGREGHDTGRATRRDSEPRSTGRASLTLLLVFAVRYAPNGLQMVAIRRRCASREFASAPCGVALQQRNRLLMHLDQA